jgi:mercuric ion transport protein
MTVELIYDNECPNVPAARAQLFRALVLAGLSVQWREWDRRAPHSPPHIRTYGSPTILVNGKDISDASRFASADCCRLYLGSDGRLSGVPEVREIASALLKAHNEESREKTCAPARLMRPGVLASLPTITLLSTLTCPACWPACVSVSSALGLGFLNYSPFP